MLSKENNRILCETAPDTRMGALLRRFWIPACLSSQVAEPNGAPLRVRLVSENFVAWRDKNGKLGFFDEFCPHRGASLALGSSEGDGLRCLYHGWKFATDGTILETPNCNNDNIKKNLRAGVFPVREAGGLVWVYLGPVGQEPPFPHYKFFDVAVEKMPIYHAEFDCNWVQIMEGTIDPSHAHILHQDPDKLNKHYEKKGVASTIPGVDADKDSYQKDISAVDFFSDDVAPECEVEDTTFGVQGISIHNGLADGEGVHFGRLHTWVMPFLAIPATNNFVISVPIDDTHCSFYALQATEEPDDAKRKAFITWLGGPAELYDGYRFKPGPDERWGQDRSKMTLSFTGVPGVASEDAAVTLSMGPIFDRSKEHLVPADALVSRVRRRLLNAAVDLEKGSEPYMLQPDESHKLGGDMKLLPDPAQWREVIAYNNEPFRVKKAKEAVPAE